MQTISKTRKNILYNLFLVLKSLLDIRNKTILAYDWNKTAREKQKTPKGGWRTWLIIAGRGFGKTRTGSETIRQWVKEKKFKQIALIGKSEDEVKKVMIEGNSGILSVHTTKEMPKYESSKGKITWKKWSNCNNF